MTDIEIPWGKRTAKYRFFEILPGACTYIIIALPIVLSLINPLYGSIFVAAFIMMWFVKAIGITYRTLQGYRTMEKAKKINWAERLNDLEDPQKALEQIKTGHKLPKQWQFKRHYQNLQQIAQLGGEYPLPSTIYNAIIIPFMHTDPAILEVTVKSIIQSNYDTKNRVILILASEERVPGVPEFGEYLAKKYAKDFYSITNVTHPADLPNDPRGKGSNLVWAGKYLQKWLEEKKIDPQKVIVTSLDEDHRPDPNYFNLLTYEYIVDPNRNHRAFQPIELYLNNIWDAPAPMRVLATGNSFWGIINSIRPNMLRNFSSHSQGMASLIATKLWSKRSIVEDGHQYWRSYFTFDGNYAVTSINLPIYIDAVLSETYVKTLREQFKQLRRWAYGASDIPYVADKGFRKGRTVPLGGLIARFFRLLDSHVSWATAPIIITVGAWIPLLVSSDSNRSIVAHELPQIASGLQTIAVLGLFLTIFLSFKMLPKRPERYKRHRTLGMLAQWLLMPIVSVCYGSASALNAQTRLMFGGYLEKWDATVKVVKR